MVRTPLTMHCAEIVPGLVSKVLPQDQVLDEALKLGEEIAAFSQPVVAMCKEAVNSGNPAYIFRT